MIYNYLRILRIGHWPKQIFLIPGFIYAIYLMDKIGLDLNLIFIIQSVLICTVIANLASSANYCINEYLDSKYDKYHPLKKNRPSVQNKINPISLFVIYFILVIICLYSSYSINYSFFLSTLVFLISGIFYNVEPLRTKDIKIFDVLSESFNNPIRLALGYTIFIDDFNLPIFFVLSYWFGGSFLMACKRLSEKLFLKDENIIKKYRPSISKYSLKDLKIHIYIYSMLSIIFLFLFLSQIDIAYSIMSLSLIYLFYDYYKMSVELTSDVQTPEKLFFKKTYILKISSFFILLFLVLYFYEKI